MAKKHDLQHILNIGDQLFRLQGYCKTGTDEILREADFPRSSFYYHFGSKEGFALQTLEYYGSYNRAYLEKLLLNEAIASPLERIRKYFSLMIDYSTQKEFATCCLIHHFSIELGGHPGAIPEKANEQFQSWLKILITCIEEGQSKGEIKETLNANDLAYFLFSLLYGMFTFARLNREKDRFRRIVELGFNMIAV